MLSCSNVQITNFSTSWNDGLAFCALIHHFLPESFDYSKLDNKHRRQNFELAFRVADSMCGFLSSTLVLLSQMLWILSNICNISGKHSKMRVFFESNV
uniref:Calponin-homology (CH) domain-containing protein n=1 Tax=Megaselia scalaris TaxID=36166 RepID=T1GX30_MEGSC